MTGSQLVGGCGDEGASNGSGSLHGGPCFNRLVANDTEAVANISPNTFQLFFGSYAITNHSSEPPLVVAELKR